MRDLGGAPDASVDDATVEASTADAARDVDGPDADAATGSDAFVVSYGCGTSQGDLLAYYPLDETSGAVAKDCFAAANNGAVLNPTNTAWTAGKHGGALQLQGTNGPCPAVDFATPTFVFGGSPAAPFTVALWINLASLPPSGQLGYIAGQSSNPGVSGWRIAVSGNTSDVALSIPDGKGGIVFVNGDAVDANKWHHVAVVYAGSSATVYVDGAPGAPTSTPTSFTADDPKTDSMRLGCSSDNQHPLQAKLDDVRYYRRALTAAEILTLYEAP